MILERFFQKRKELKTANTWLNAMKTREIQKNSFHQSGNVKQAREFAFAVMQEAKQPVIQPEIREEPQLEPTTIFNQNMLKPAPILSEPAIAL